MEQYGIGHGTRRIISAFSSHDNKTFSYFDASDRISFLNARKMVSNIETLAQYITNALFSWAYEKKHPMTTSSHCRKFLCCVLKGICLLCQWRFDLIWILQKCYPYSFSWNDYWKNACDTSLTQHLLAFFKFCFYINQQTLFMRTIISNQTN